MFKNLSQLTKRASLCRAPALRSLALANTSVRSVSHIKNMLDEARKIEVQELNQLPMIEKTTRIYKPTYTIEFDRAGEVLVYSANPFKEMTIYFKYPYVLYESLLPLSFFMWYVNPLGVEWWYNHLNLFVMYQCITPRIWYLRSLQQRIVKMWLVRGGKFIKVETHTLAGDINFAWVENYNFHPLTEDQKNFDNRDDADFLEKEGQLKYDLACQLDNFTEFGVNQNDQIIYFLKNGIIHHPELFEAVCKGYNVDTSDFVINTAHNLRAREGSTNFQIGIIW